MRTTHNRTTLAVRCWSMLLTLLAACGGSGPVAGIEGRARLWPRRRDDRQSHRVRKRHRRWNRVLHIRRADSRITSPRAKRICAWATS